MLEPDQEDGEHLAGLDPPLHKLDQGTKDLQRWLNHVRLSQNVIDTILRSSAKNPAAVKSRWRLEHTIYYCQLLLKTLMQANLAEN